MTFFAVAALITIVLIAYTFFVRKSDLPAPAGPQPWQHLETRKAAIYENLRDLQFEYRLGKLSDDDYNRTKTELQAELATLLAEIDTLKGARAPEAVAARNGNPGHVCPHCKAKFERDLKFCGECGKPMAAVEA